MEQLTFIEETKEEKLERKIKHLEDLCDRLRKGQYAQINSLKKLYFDLKQEHEDWKAVISRKPSSLV